MFGSVSELGDVCSPSVVISLGSVCLVCVSVIARVSRTLSQSVSGSLNQSVSGSLNQSVSGSLSQSVSLSVGHFIKI